MGVQTASKKVGYDMHVWNSTKAGAEKRNVTFMGSLERFFAAIRGYETSLVKDARRMD